jgi:triosephosphate isomerase
MKPRGTLIAGNWKMNHGPADTEKFFSALKASWEKMLSPSTRAAIQSKQVRCVAIPPMLSIQAALRAASGQPVKIAVQNVHWEQKGAFTGEVSGPMVKELGIDTVLVGHSERRQYFGETDETVRKRTESLLEQGLDVIMCIGETRSEREAGKTEAVLLKQLGAVFQEPGKGAAKFLNGKLIIAYEPVWAIGTGLTATPQQAEEAHQIIRKFLFDRFGMEAAGKTSILYGGSVTPENAVTLMSCANIDGCLVGGASIKPESYLALVEAGGKVLG